MLDAFASQQYLENIDRFLKAFDSAGIDPRIFSDPDLRAAAEIACADLTSLAEAYNAIAPGTELSQVTRFKQLFSLNSIWPNLTLLHTDTAELTEQLDALARQREAQEAEQRALRRARLEQTISKLRRPEASTPAVDQEKEERATKLREAIARANEKLSNPDLN